MAFHFKLLANDANVLDQNRKNKAVLRAIMNLCTALEVKSGVGLCTVMISCLFVRWRTFRSGYRK